LLKKMKQLSLFLILAGIFINAQTLEQTEVRKMMNFVGQHYHTPSEAFDLGMEEIRYSVDFKIEKDGKISDYKISQKNVDCKTCEKELMRVFSQIPAVNPVMLDGNPVRVNYQLPVRIRIQDAQETPSDSLKIE